MDEKSLKPQLRFKGFADAWEQRKFKSTIQIERGGSPRPIEDYITNSENGLNWIKIGDAPSMGKYITKTAEKIKPEGLSKTREVHPGDLILSNSMSFGRPYIMAINGCIHDGWLLLRNDKNLYDLQFLCHLLGSENMLHQYKSFAAGSTVNNLNKDLVGNTTVSFPKKTEQSKLGAFFDSLDNLITLHQRKLDKLSNVKKALLEKMFPKNDSDVPEIRFKGFTDAWEQRKLNECAEIIGGGTPSTSISEYWNGNIDWYAPAEMEGKRYADGSVKKITDLGLKNSSAKMLPANKTILFTSRAGIGKMAILVKPACTNQGFQSLVLKDDIAPYFIYSMESRIKNKAERIAAGSTFLEISGKLLGCISLHMPKNTEQQKIGTFFSNLDNLITLHQRKLEKLKNIKKACLEKMFV